MFPFPDRKAPRGVFPPRRTGALGSRPACRAKTRRLLLRAPRAGIGSYRRAGSCAAPRPSPLHRKHSFRIFAGKCRGPPAGSGKWTASRRRPGTGSVRFSTPPQKCTPAPRWSPDTRRPESRGTPQKFRAPSGLICRPLYTKARLSRARGRKSPEASAAVFPL